MFFKTMLHMPVSTFDFPQEEMWAHNTNLTQSLITEVHLPSSLPVCVFFVSLQLAYDAVSVIRRVWRYRSCFWNNHHQVRRVWKYRSCFWNNLHQVRRVWRYHSCFWNNLHQVRRVWRHRSCFWNNFHQVRRVWRYRSCFWNNLHQVRS